MTRRRFLRGAGGVVVGLPFLEGLSARRAGAVQPSSKFAVFVRQGNGVQQATDSGEPESFWPSFAPGAFTPAALAADTGRAVSGSSRTHAKDLTIVRGLRFNDPANACRHSGGGNQVLTAASVGLKDKCNASLAEGQSLDNLIQNQLAGDGNEPLTLICGPKSDQVNEVLSYRGPLDLRGAERNPYNAYASLFGLSTVTETEKMLMRARRQSVNDLVRSELQSLLARKDFSRTDRTRLDRHLTSIRELEIGVSCAAASSSDYVARLEAGASIITDDAQIDAVVKLHMDVIVMAIACGARRAATLQIGSGPDGTRYTIDGVQQPEFHGISHRRSCRILSSIHSKIDRKILGLFKYLLDQLATHTTAQGTTLLDEEVAVYVNDLATGGHSYDNVPYLLVGKAGGALKTGLYVDAGDVPNKVFTTNNKILNTIGAAVGCKNAAGEPLDDFGDPALDKGTIARDRSPPARRSERDARATIPALGDRVVQHRAEGLKRSSFGTVG